MKDYDEYQRFMRYRNGYHAFFLITFLILISFLVSLAVGGEWAESKGVEYFILLLISSTFINIRNTWYGAYYRKKDNPFFYNAIFFIIGLLYILIFGFYNGDTEVGLIVGGKVTWQAAQLLMGVLWICIPITYFLRYYIYRKKD